MAGRKRSRSKLRFSKIYTFACGTSSFRDDHSRIGDPGFSYKAYINDSDNFAENIKYGSNYVYTTKYSLANFFPKALFEQFRRVANLYFLLSVVLSFTPVSPFMQPMSFILPLVIVIGATMAKEAVEDWRRFQQDNEVNNRKVQVRLADGTFNNVEWKNVRVGDIVRMEKDNFFPADLLLLSSSYEDGICYVETMNLDGETNLKLKQALEVTSKFHDDSDFTSFTSVVRCEDPNANLYSFVGTMDYNDYQYPLSPQQLLLRGSKLRNTEYIFGAVIFSGHNTKVMQNATEPPSKRSTIEKRMDKIIYFLFSLLVLISAIGSVIFGRELAVEDHGSPKKWYLRPDQTDIYNDPQRVTLAAFFHFLTAMIVYGYFIPISLYISVEIVKILQSMFINQDINMYYENTDMPAQARTSNLNEELGQVHTILSDKTGTLTSNSLDFIKCSIAGTAYGIGVTEVERAMSQTRRALLFNEPDVEDQGNNNINRIKGFNFRDDRLTCRNWVHEQHSDVIRMFFRTLATCHTAIPEVDDDSGKTSYEAESPDEAAFVIAAREFGFEFYERNQSSIKTLELDPDSGKKIERTYEILNTLDFSSMRRRMSVVIKDEEKLLLVSKGADSVMFERLAVNGRMFEEKTREHINEYADAGLRTLVLAYRELSEEEYNNFNKIFLEAKKSVTADRDEKLEAAAELIEKDLILLGATAVEDKLQIGVPECIDKLAQAGIKIWVLTGDKMETAVNIGFSCSLLRQGMKQIIITLDGPEISSLEKEGSKDVITKESRAHVAKQITKGKSELGSSSNEVFALIIDGKSLAFALENELKDTFLALAIGCASVICCRSSPKQKALVTRLVKIGVGKTTLAIGDGANDVGMLQEADIGIGISGVEGQQAVMASDVAIAQFRFLERLLLVHGHWCYRRIASMICYFFYKNIALGFTLFIFEGYTSFSGQAAYNEWYMALYNTLFTSLPAIALGVFDQDVSARYCLKFPQLYQQGVQNLLFRWVRILVWMFNGVLNSLTIFFFCAIAFETQAFRKSGETADYQILGTMMFTVVVWVVNCQMALFVRYFTLIQHIFIWGGIALWYVFLLVYGSITPTASTTAFMVFLEELSPSVSFWVVTFFVVIATLLPYFSYSAIQIRFFPMYHEKIQWLRLRGQPEELGHIIRDSSFRETSVGFTARVEAVANQIGGPESDATHTR